jgi:hypothetical protein
VDPIVGQQGSTANPKLAQALALWAEFPADAAPRPLVLTGTPVMAPEMGFKTVEDKEAFLSGLFVAPASFPSGPIISDGYPVISATEALDLLITEGSPSPLDGLDPLVITAVRLGTGSFGTDRGMRPLPAWRISFVGVQNPGTVLAVADSAQFIQPVPHPLAVRIGASIGGDDRSLTIHFVGGPETGPGQDEYAAEFVESATAVAVTITTVPRPLQLGHARRAVGYSRYVTITLATGLGGRVVVDESGRAVSVKSP